MPSATKSYTSTRRYNNATAPPATDVNLPSVSDVYELREAYCRSRTRGDPEEWEDLFFAAMKHFKRHHVFVYPEHFPQAKAGWLSLRSINKRCTDFTGRRSGRMTPTPAVTAKSRGKAAVARAFPILATTTATTAAVAASATTVSATAEARADLKATRGTATR